MERARKNSIVRYVKLEDRMTNSAAWTDLSDKAIWLYIELLKRFNYSQGGLSHLILPFSEVKWRMSRGTFAKKMNELVDHGFIRKVKQGGLYRNPNVYTVSNNWEKKSSEIVCNAGREAIRLGLATKPSSRNNLQNLKGKRTWEKSKIEPGKIL